MSEDFSRPPSLNACLDRLRAWARAKQLKPARLAREAGIAESVTRDLALPNWSPTASSIRKLEAIVPAHWKAGDALPDAEPGPSS